MATETRSEQQTETKAPNTFEQLIELGRDNGYKLDWFITRETLGDSIEAEADRGGLLEDASPVLGRERLAAASKINRIGAIGALERTAVGQLGNQVEWGRCLHVFSSEHSSR